MDLHFIKEEIKVMKEVKFSKHFLEEVLKNRPYLTKELIVEKLKKIENLYKSENQSKNKYKLIYNLSNKYDLIIVIKFEEKSLKVITSYKNSKKWQKMISKQAMMK